MAKLTTEALKMTEPWKSSSGQFLQRTTASSVLLWQHVVLISRQHVCVPCSVSGGVGRGPDHHAERGRTGDDPVVSGAAARVLGEPAQHHDVQPVPRGADDERPGQHGRLGVR